MDSRIKIGIDLGGTKIAAIALDSMGRTLAYERVDAAAHDYGLTLDKIRALVERIERQTGQRGSIGIGTPGAVSPQSGLMRNSNSACLNGQPLDQDLMQLLGREIRMANDADCFALSEAVDGAAAGATSVFGVIIGTGVGGGLVIQGKLVNGPNAIAGEWGHNPLPYMDDQEHPGNPCYCGKSGCIETFLSGPGMARHFALRTGRELTAREIVAAVADEQDAADALQRYCDRLARALSVVINIVDPEVVVLGGGLSNIDALYEQVPRYWQEYVFSDVVRTQLVKHRHGDDSGVRGAANLYS